MSISNSAKTLERSFGVSKGITKESDMASGLRKFTFWLSSLTALLSFSAVIFWFQATRTPRTDPDQVRFAAENVKGTVSLAEAIQALAIRH
jgi:nucleoside-diphosphate-sugar epimerase